MIKEESNREEEINEKIRMSHVCCSICGSFQTILHPINIGYRLTKKRGPKIMGYQEKPFIGEATKLTNEIFKDCKKCNHRERIKPEEVKYFIDGYLGIK